MVWPEALNDRSRDIPRTSTPAKPVWRAFSSLYGCPVVLSGPFTQQIHDARRWRAWVADLGGEPVHLVWVRSDAATLQRRLYSRGSGRDAAKLAGFEAFTARMRPDVEPAAPHTAVDNRLSAPAPLEAQVSALVAALQPG